MSDIVTRLRQTRADMIGTDDEQHFWDCFDAVAEIQRLRQLVESMGAAIETAGFIYRDTDSGPNLVRP